MLRDIISEALRLFIQSGDQLIIGQLTRPVETFMQFHDEDAVRVNVGVAIAEDLLELLNGSQGTKHAGSDSGESDGASLEAFRERNHINEVFEHESNLMRPLIN